MLVGGGLTVGEHVRNMFWTAGPALGISLVIFLVLGLNADPEAVLSTDVAREALATAFNIGFVNLLPLLPLDGGHIAFSIIEGVRGRALGRELYERVSVIGIAFVLVLFVIGLSNDVG